MSTTLMNKYVCLETAKEVWDSFEAMYTDTSDETQIFELHRKCFSTKQTGRSLATYYDELAAIFQEIDQRNTVKGESVESIALLQKYVGRFRVHMFLSGLDSIETRPLRLDLECTHCGEKGHTKQRCYEVIGYPEWWDFTKRPKKNIATKKDPAKSPPSVNVAQSGMKTNSSVLFVKSLNSTWLIDTGASDHMDIVTRQVLGCGVRKGNLYYLDLESREFIE
ncbi:hypothetical protein LWI28_000549 [Acer negundo]|uniref:CCHC-type domain-containing protein n=1 Tax=Acer negundo TaxID=4023 RepID=A0AAD5J3T2_ACENE|nr:hypothetical protein LWI28_000549 [Acer negundo]